MFLNSENVNIVLHLQNLYGLTNAQKKGKALKLHRQFSHASYEKLLKLLQEGGCEEDEFLKCVKQV